VSAQQANHPKGPTGARRAALVVWVAWLAGTGLLWWGTLACVMHPQCFALVSLLLVQIVGATVAACLGLWRTVRGPRRLAALDWALVGIIPILLWVAQTSYVFGSVNVHSRLPMNVATRTGLVAGAALADGEARVRFPRRLASQHVVMIYDELADPAGDLGAMERHVAEMERVLGRPSRVKVHWVRGMLLGMGPRGFQGMATGFAEDGPTEVDRHEVAHAFISQFVPADAEPPTVLSEGWAESHQGVPSERLARKAWLAQSNGRLPTLRELVGPEWYFRMRHAAYVYGAALVDYLLREHGAEKFLELYTTCRQETFAADCERILGVGIDELEERFWADVAEIASRPALPADQSVSALVGLPEPEPIDEAAREEFLAQYLPAAEKLEAAFRQVRIEAVTRRSRRGFDGERADAKPEEENHVEQLDTVRKEIARSGERARLVLRTETGVYVDVAAPEASFSLQKQSDEGAFRIACFATESTDRYGGVLARIEGRLCPLQAAYRVADWSIPFWMSQPEFRITAVSRSERDGKPLVTVGFEYVPIGPDGAPLLQAGWFTVAPDDGWTVQDYELRVKDLEFLGVYHGHVEYGPAQDGAPTLRRVEIRHLLKDVLESKDVWKLQTSIDFTHFEFGPVVPEREFRLAAFGLEPPPEGHVGTARVERMGQVDIFARVLHGTLWSLAAIVGVLVVSVPVQCVRKPRRDKATTPLREGVSGEAPPG